MKKTLFYALVLMLGLAMIACSSPEKKAQKIIENHLDEYSPIWRVGVTSIEYGALENTYTTIQNDPEFADKIKNIETLNGRLESNGKVIETYKKIGLKKHKKEIDERIAQQEQIQAEIDAAVVMFDSLEKVYVPKQVGYHMTQRTTLVDEGQRVMTLSNTFYLDQNLLGIAID